MTRSVDDPRELPPLGWCAECIREATWVRAATMWQGTALCAQHTVYTAGVGDIDIEEDLAPLGKPQAVVDALRRGIHQKAVQAGF
ncbi:hypothetical protein GCM10010221_46130 [Streptomyces parvus]|uniref:hypothetical protein n=1 Tax=Streptomyces parvus TaxID=66428 RepID=UPI00142EAF40|nr:hypothetical protein [Streptomyces parvus]GGS42009.1 hypothetical protein GCM10010221_46130 [Streptomyces parvus]